MMAENEMTAGERAAVQALIDAGEKVWLVHPEGYTIGIKFEDDAMRQIEMRVRAGYTLTKPPR